MTWEIQVWRADNLGIYETVYTETVTALEPKLLELKAEYPTVLSEFDAHTVIFVVRAL